MAGSQLDADRAYGVTLDVVVPVFNEIDCLKEFARRFEATLPRFATDDVAVHLILVDDGSTDGSSALAKMNGKQYGLVISDWNMEPMTGYELLKQVRANPQMAGTPFIMITAESKTENVVAAKQAGANNYIIKPFNAETLKHKIEAVFTA